MNSQETLEWPPSRECAPSPTIVLFSSCKHFALDQRWCGSDERRAHSAVVGVNRHEHPEQLSGHVIPRPSVEPFNFRTLLRIVTFVMTAGIESYCHTGDRLIAGQSGRGLKVSQKLSWLQNQHSACTLISIVFCTEALLVFSLLYGFTPCLNFLRWEVIFITRKKVSFLFRSFLALCICRDAAWRFLGQSR